MPTVLRRVFVPSPEPETAALEIGRIFRRHVQSAITPPLNLQATAGGVVLDLDVRAYDNYRVDDALMDVRRSFGGVKEIETAAE